MTGALVREYNGHQGAVYSVDAGRVPLRSANNRMTMIASGSADTSVIIWSLRSGNRYETFDASTDAVYASSSVQMVNLSRRVVVMAKYGSIISVSVP